MLGNNNIPDYNQDNDTYNKSFAEKNININRKTTPNKILKQLKNKKGVKMWDIDPSLLKDYADNMVVQIFVDTLSKDIAKYEYKIKSDDEVDKDLNKKINNIFLNKNWNQAIEETVRDISVTGNAFWVKHRYNNEEIGEIVIPNPETMYVHTNENGIIDGYVQKTGLDSGKFIDKDDVIHFKFSSSSDSFYSDSPVSKSKDVIEIIDELIIKEALDLKEGAQSGILTQTESHPTNPMNTEEWNDFVYNLTEANLGKRNKFGVTSGKYDWISFDSNYDDLKILERYKFHISNLGAAFKVNPSYVGFDFQNTNRATDESQRKSYKERGVYTLLNQLKDKINADLIQEFDDDKKFDWDYKDDDNTEEIQYYKELAETAKKLNESGINYEITDESISIIDNDGNTEEKDDENDDIDINMSKRKTEFVDEFDGDDFKSTLKNIEDEFDTRTDAFNHIKERMSGSMSLKTYYDWIESCNLK